MSADIRIENGNLIVTRQFGAPREEVFEAWVETSKVQQWWGCAECTSVRSEIEPCVGGQYNHHMTIKDVGEVPGFAILTEYDPPARLAYETASPTNPDDKMTVTVEFTEVEGGTRVQLVQMGIPDIKVQGDIELLAIVQQGWTAAFGKLDSFLSSTAS